MVQEIWRASDGSITLGGTDYTNLVKEISITGGDRPVEQERFFGASNVYAIEKPQEPFDCTLTCRKKDVSLVMYLFGGSDATIPYAYSGDATRSRYAVIYNWCDVNDPSGAQLRISMASAFAISQEMRQTVDDYLTETVSFKCLSRDMKQEYTSLRIGSPLPA